MYKIYNYEDLQKNCMFSFSKIAWSLVKWLKRTLLVNHFNNQNLLIIYTLVVIHHLWFLNYSKSVASDAMFITYF